MPRINEFIFEILLFVFSALMLVLMLFGCIRLRQAEDASQALESSIAQQRRENRLLQARCESCMSLEELEKYAINELGMQQCRPWQIVYIDISDTDVG